MTLVGRGHHVGMHVPSTDGVQVAVHDLGGSGAPLVLAHATGFCARAYEPLAAELAGHFHVWGLDFRGHGDSTSPDNERFEWDAMAEDLEAAVAGVADGPVAVFGHSLGGGAAMLLEHRRPGTFRWAYLFEPIILPAGYVSDGTSALPAGAARRRPTFPSRGDAMVRYASRPPLNLLRADSLLAYVQHGFRDEPDGSVTLKCTPEHEAATFAATGKATIEMLTEITTPTTIAVGSPGPGWTPASLAPEQVAALRNGRLEEQPVLGHFGPLQGPVTVAAGILAASRA